MFPDHAERHMDRSSADRMDYLLWGARRLRVTGQALFMVTGANLALVFALWVLYRLLPLLTTAMVLFIALSSALTLAAVVLAMMFEALRRRGDREFESMSAELQVYHRRAMAASESEEEPSGGFVRDAQVALGAFTAAGNVPLIPGQFGPTLYALSNIAFTLFLMLAHSGVRAYY